MNPFIRYILLGTVFLTGSAVLIIEVTAVRILSPYYGSSLTVFSSILTIVLGALSLGYYVGGKLADRAPRHQPLYALIALSGVAILISTLLATYVLPGGSTLVSSVWGPLIFSGLLFFIPAFLLGVDSPYVIKLQSTRFPVEETGRVVGATFFWSTVGSITGSLLTGFVLVPTFGVKLTIVGTAVCLVILGVVGSLVVSRLGDERDHTWYEIFRKQGLFFVSVIIVTLALVGSIKANQTLGKQTAATIFSDDGLYSYLRIDEGYYRGKLLRILHQDTNNSSAVYMDNYDLPFGYAQFAPLFPDLVPDAQSFLMLGAGSYTIPRTLLVQHPELQITVSELEPSLLGIAEDYFDFDHADRIQNELVDGRVLLSRSDATYDVIFGDAFGSDLSIPFHLTTREFFTEVKASLNPEGVFMLNYIGRFNQPAPSLTGSLIATLRSVFPTVSVYALNPDSPTTTQNIIIVARNGSTPITFADTRQIDQTNGETKLVSELAYPVSRIPTAGEYILTDDFAPVEYLMVAQR
jgi:spermidine synthase